MMALVTSLEESAKVRSTVHRPTRCYYAIVEGAGGDRYLQLDTVGSTDREYRDKISQSIQFDRQAASQLIKILRKAFPDLTDRGDSDDSAPIDPEDEASEGRILLRLHRSRERNGRLIMLKKQAVLKADGRLRCEVCDFDFERVYGHMGRGYAECHHRTPLAESGGATRTRFSDLAIVCSNCHRMLHRPPFLTVEALRELVAGRASPQPLL